MNVISGSTQDQQVILTTSAEVEPPPPIFLVASPVLNTNPQMLITWMLMLTTFCRILQSYCNAYLPRGQICFSPPRPVASPGRGDGRGRTAPGDTIQLVTPDWNYFCGWKFRKNTG